MTDMSWPLSQRSGIEFSNDSVFFNRTLFALFHDSLLHLCSGYAELPGPPGTTLRNLS